MIKRICLLAILWPAVGLSKSVVFSLQQFTMPITRVRTVINDMEAHFQSQTREFSGFSYPEKLEFSIAGTQDLRVVGDNLVYLPETSYCSAEELIQQVTHEVGHLLFANRLKQEDTKLSRDYQQLMIALQARDEFFEEYDRLERNSDLISRQRLKELDRLLAIENVKIQKHQFILKFVFPLEELFADLYAVLYFQSAKTMRNALDCYTLQEAIDRDYSIDVGLDYQPEDPYGHSDYLLFGHYFYNFSQVMSLSKNKSLEVLFRQIIEFVSSISPAEEYDFKSFNLRLLHGKSLNDITED